MANFRIKSTSNILFTGAMTDTNYLTEEIPTYGATLIIDVNTSDANTNVSTTEVVTSANLESNTPGYLTLVTTVKSNDKNIVVLSQPSVSHPDIDITSSAVESNDENNLLITTVTSTVTKNNECLDIYSETKYWNNIGLELQQPKYRYLILRHSVIQRLLHGNPGGDYNMTCNEMYSLFNYSCVKMSEGLYQTLKATWYKEEIIEIDEKTAYYGCTFFSEIRPVAKLWEAKNIFYGDKVPVEITPEIVGYILTVMKIFAREIIESEYERRYLSLRNASTIEVDSWALQQAEAKEWLTYNGADGHITPLLDYMAQERNVDKTVLANKILQKAEDYQDRFSKMLVEMQKLIKKFEECSSVWDINTLYEDYFGIAMPIRQAVALGRTVAENDWTRKPEWSVKGNGYYF